MTSTPDLDALLTRLYGPAVLIEKDENALAALVHAASFGRTELQAVHDFIARQSVTIELDGRKHSVPAVMELTCAEESKDTLGLMTQLHGNEAAGLAGIGLALAFWRRGMLKGTVYAIIGTPLAARQYFAAWEQNPDAPQESRDLYRRGFDEQGKLLRDPNRIPSDFRQNRTDPHNARAIELEALAERFTATLDIHSARGDLICVTEFSDFSHLLYSPIRNVLGELASNIGSHSASVTFKTLLMQKPAIRALTGIEAGRHEDPASPGRASAFTHALLYNLGMTEVVPHPHYVGEDGVFQLFQVEGTLAFSALAPLPGPTLQPGDVIYTVRPADLTLARGPDVENVLLRHADGTLRVKPVTDVSSDEAASIVYREYQFGELEEVRRGQLVAVAVPSGAQFAAPQDFHTLFVAKRAALYEDKAAGILPVPAAELQQKFTYLCKRGEVRIVPGL